MQPAPSKAEFFCLNQSTGGRMGTKMLVRGGSLIVAFLAVAGNANAQWSGTNPVTTSSSVGIGTSSPLGPFEISSTAYRLHLNDTGGSSANVGLALEISGSAKWSLAAFQCCGDVLSDYFQVYYDAGSWAGLTVVGNSQTVSVGGPFFPAADNSYTLGKSGLRWSAVWSANGTIQTSDRRLKKDISDIDYGLKKIKNLRPVSFKWRTGTDNHTHLGLIAQEVEEVVPEAVMHGEQPSDPLGMNYSEL